MQNDPNIPNSNVPNSNVPNSNVPNPYQQQPYMPQPDGSQQPYPQQPYPQQPQPKKKSKVGCIVGSVIGVVVLCGILGIVAAVSNSGSTTTKTDSSATTQTTSQKASTSKTDTQTSAPAGNAKVGVDVKVNSDWSAKVLDVKTSTGNDYEKPKAGNIYLIVHVSLKNTSNATKELSSLLSFKLKDTDGQSYNETFFTDAGSTPDGKITANSPAAGFIVYEVPTAQHNFTFDFEPDLLGNDVTTWDLSI